MGNFPFGSQLNTPLSSVGYQQLGGAHSQASRQWQAYMANRQYFGQLIACIGDSFTSGFNPGLTDFEQTWPFVFGQLFSGRYPTIGLDTHGRGFLPPDVPNTGLTLSYVAVTGAPGEVKGLGLNLYTYDISPGDNVVLTYSLVGDNFIISYCLQPGGGDFTWQLDGGAVNTVHTVNATVSDTGIVFESTGGAPGTAHTLVISYVASTGPCYIDGVIEFNGDLSKGIQMYNLGASDSTTGDWANQDFSMLAALVPSLVIIELGAADWQDGFTPADVAGALQAIMDAINAVVTQPVAYQLLITPAPVGVTSPYTWDQYVSAIYALAENNASPNVDVLDFSLRMPVADGAGGPYGLYNANGELTNIAHSLVADTQASYLGPA